MIVVMPSDPSPIPSEAFLPLDWISLETLVPSLDDRVEGPTNSQATLRLFGRPEAALRVTLYRDHHAWCPYCQKVWLWLEERQVPYRIRKVTMVLLRREGVLVPPTCSLRDVARAWRSTDICSPKATASWRLWKQVLVRLVQA